MQSASASETSVDELKASAEGAFGGPPWLAELDPSVIDVRRGLIRVLVMAAGLFWFVAAADTLQTYRNEPARSGGLILQTQEDSYYQVQLDGGVACEAAIGDIARDFRARGMGTVRADACAKDDANRQALRAREGRRAALEALSGYAIGFAAIAGLVAAAWWAIRGFFPTRSRRDADEPAREGDPIAT